MIRALSAVAALAFAVAGPALAEGNLDPFPPATDGTLAFSRPATVDTGSDAYAAASGPAVAVTSGAVLPSNGSNGIVQSANSLPPSWADGTSAYAYAQSVNQYFAEQIEPRATKMARVGTGGSRG
jgi:hypothetical protein